MRNILKQLEKIEKDLKDSPKNREINSIASISNREVVSEKKVIEEVTKKLFIDDKLIAVQTVQRKNGQLVDEPELIVFDEIEMEWYKIHSQGIKGIENKKGRRM